MKLAGFLAATLAITAFAQTSSLHGTRIGQVQTAYLSEGPTPGEFPLPVQRVWAIFPARPP